MKAQLCFFLKTFSSIPEYNFLLIETSTYKNCIAFLTIKDKVCLSFCSGHCGESSTPEYTFLVTEHLHVGIVYPS